VTTTDRRLLNDSDAVIFHARDLHPNDLPPPGQRRPHQNFVFFLLESPMHTDFKMLQMPLFQNYFNRTMTYRFDSDVVNTYGRIRCIDSSSSCSNFPPGNTLSAQSNFNPAVIASSNIQQMNLTVKNRTAAWFVSNCKTSSQRELLVRNLSNFIPVDVYGSCRNNGSNHTCVNRADCNVMLGRYYRFYLSFENSLCPDYVTEKLYRTLMHDTVPVVYGGANYSLYLPEGSYVNARDFDSPENLANHLKELMVNDELYLSYFRWKQRYTVELGHLNGWCSLCRLLNDRNDVEKKSYADIAAWWSGQLTNQTCFTPPPTSLV
jgi:alpha-1,3-fucosyltransferase